MLSAPLMIDAANAVNRSHHFAPDNWWIANTSRLGGSKWFDLMSPQDVNLGHHGTLTNMGSSSSSGWQIGSPHQPGHFGALAFDGSNDYVDVGDHAWFTTVTAMTWIVDVYPKAASPFPGIIGKGNSDSSTNGSFLLFMSGGTTFGWIVYNASSRTTTSTASVTLNAWNHVAASASLGNRVALHINGVLKSSTGLVSTAFDSPAFSLLFGSNAGNSGNTVYPLNGLISSIRFYKRVFTDQALKEIYYHSLAGYPGLLRNAYGMYKVGTATTGWGALLGEYRNRLVIA